MPKTFNEGAGGFHMYTVVTDGYGGLIAEDMYGRELARVTTNPAQAEDPAPFAELARLAFAVLNGDADPVDPAAAIA